MKKLISFVLLALLLIPVSAYADEFRNFRDNLGIKGPRAIVDVYKNKQQILQIVSTKEEIVIRDSDDVDNVFRVKSITDKKTGKVEVDFKNSIKNEKVLGSFNLPLNINSNTYSTTRESIELIKRQSRLMYEDTIKGFKDEESFQELLDMIANYIGYSDSKKLFNDIKFIKGSDVAIINFDFNKDNFLIVSKLIPTNMLTNLPNDLIKRNKEIDEDYSKLAYEDNFYIMISTREHNNSKDIINIRYKLMGKDSNLEHPEMSIRKYSKDKYFGGEVQLSVMRALSIICQDLDYEDKHLKEYFGLNNNIQNCSYISKSNNISIETCEKLYTQQYNRFVEHYNILMNLINNSNKSKDRFADYISKIMDKEVTIKDIRGLNNKSGLIINITDKDDNNWVVEVNFERRFIN